MKGFVNIKGREIKKARIEIVPMIDAIFFLLVFFMYSSLSMVKMKGMGVSIPKLSNQPVTKQKAPPRRYIVTVDAAGNSFINLDSVPMDQLTQRLASYIAGDTEGTIVVNVDKTQAVQTLVTVMDKVNDVRTPKGTLPAIIIATSPVNPRKEAAAAAAAGKS